MHSPVDGVLLGAATLDTPASVETKIARSHHAFEVWRSVPAPKRGELVRLLGDELRQVKEPLSLVVTLECSLMNSSSVPLATACLRVVLFCITNIECFRFLLREGA
jgi:acyl-CoA reductase-like NAD-dependent aldehyde dehydrogenase